MSVALMNKNNVKVSMDGNNITVTFYGTQIVSVSPYTVWLNTGGYFTATTKRHMNHASDEFGLGYSVYQVKGEWYVKHGSGVIPFDGNICILNRGN